MIAPLVSDVPVGVTTPEDRHICTFCKQEDVRSDLIAEPDCNAEGGPLPDTYIHPACIEKANVIADKLNVVLEPGLHGP